MKCYLYDRCKSEHESADKKFTEKLYFVGDLFPKPICGHCLIRLQQLTNPPPVHPEFTTGYGVIADALRAKYPEYAAIIDELGFAKVKFELGCDFMEANPSSEPTHWSQVEDYPPVKPNIVVH